MAMDFAPLPVPSPFYLFPNLLELLVVVLQAWREAVPLPIGRVHGAHDDVVVREDAEVVAHRLVVEVEGPGELMGVSRALP
jgi:hypothetical protein